MTKPRKQRQSVVKFHEIHPPACDVCGSNELVNVKNSKERPFAYFHPEEQVQYTHARELYAECAGCGVSRGRLIRIVRPDTTSVPATVTPADNAANEVT